MLAFAIIDLIGVLKTVMHYGYSGISRETNFLSGEIGKFMRNMTLTVFEVENSTSKR